MDARTIEWDFWRLVAMNLDAGKQVIMSGDVSD